MKYSGYIDGLLAEALFAKKTGDFNWLAQMLSKERDPIKRILLEEVCKESFMEHVRREGGWIKEQKIRLESIALGEIEDGVTEFIGDQMDKDDSGPKDDEGENELDLEHKGDDENDAQDQGDDSSSEGKGSGNNKCEDEPDMLSGQPSALTRQQIKKIQESLCKDTPEQRWEQMRKQAIDKYKEKLDRKSWEKAMREFQYNPSRTPNTNSGSSYLGIGGGEGELLQAENRILSKIPDSLKKLARKIGRTGGFDTLPGKSFSRASKSDISGITEGDDLNSLLPSEVALLSDKRTQDVFYKNYAEKRLQVFASASSGEQKKERKDGPVIICLDTSGSMSGEPAAIAKMLTVAVSIYAMRRKRKILVIKYSNDYAWQAFTKRKADRTALMNFLQWFGHGGNDENTMFKFLFNELLPQEATFDSADVLCISDFGWVPLDEDVKELIEKAKTGGMMFYGLAVGVYDDFDYFSGKAISNCDSRWQWRNGECVNIDDKCKCSEEEYSEDM